MSLEQVHVETTGREPALPGSNIPRISGQEPSLGGALTIQQIVSALEGENHQQRDAAIRSIRRLKSGNVQPFLIQSLRHDHARVRRAASEALIHVGDTESVESLRIATRDSSPPVRWHALLALASIAYREGDEILRGQIALTLLDGLDDPSAFVRVNAARGLKQITNYLPEGTIRDTVIDSLIDSLHDIDNAVCAASAQALGQIRDRRAVQHLLVLLGDDRAQVRRNATLALTQIAVNNDQSYRHEVILPALLNSISESTSANQRMAATSILNQIAGQGIPKPLRRTTLNTLINALTDSDWVVRRSVARALGDMGNETALPALVHRFEDPEPAVRAQSIYSVGLILLGHDDHPLQYAIVQSLIPLLEDDEETIIPIEGDDIVSSIVRTVLTQINTPEACEALNES